MQQRPSPIRPTPGQPDEAQPLVGRRADGDSSTRLGRARALASCAGVSTLLALCVCGALVAAPYGVRTLPPALDSTRAGRAADLRTALLSCLHDRWVVFYGDSVSRGIFFDLLALLSGSSPDSLRARPHAGHNASYDGGCMERRLRGAYNTSKCSMWDYALCPAADDAALDIVLAGDAVAIERGSRGAAPSACGHTAPPADAPCGQARRPRTRLTYYGKAYVYEPCVDVPVLSALGRSDPPPTDIVLGAALWDMLYTRSRAAYARGAEELIAAVRRASPQHTRVHWLGPSAIVDERLPPWKALHMSLAESAAYDQLSREAISRAGGLPAGGRYVDLWTLTSAHPELCEDGVHYPRLLDLALTVLDNICSTGGDDEPHRERRDAR